jgi:hypothetical protein
MSSEKKERIKSERSPKERKRAVRRAVSSSELHEAGERERLESGSCPIKLQHSRKLWGKKKLYRKLSPPEIPNVLFFKV